MSVPTSFSDAQAQYQEIEGYDINAKILELRTKLNDYVIAKTAQPPVPATIAIKETALNTAFNSISDYYNKISRINTFLQTHVNKQVLNIKDESLTSEERYENRVYPEEAVVSRESTYGLMPELRVRSLPYLLAMSVFMASLTIFLIFQMFGFSGQVNLPLSITAFFSSPASPIPFYSNPLFLGGAVILLLVAVVIFAVLYFKAKNANK